MNSATTFENQLEIASHWIPLVQAAGLYNDALLPQNIYRLACKIARDPVVTAAVTAACNEYARRTGKCRMPEDITAQVVTSLTPIEKRELKARIVAVMQNVKKGRS